VEARKRAGKPYFFTRAANLSGKERTHAKPAKASQQPCTTVYGMSAFPIFGAVSLDIGLIGFLETLLAARSCKCRVSSSRLPQMHVRLNSAAVVSKSFCFLNTECGDTRRVQTRAFPIRSLHPLIEMGFEIELQLQSISPDFAH
jgi:hypothetical protein